MPTALPLAAALPRRAHPAACTPCRAAAGCAWRGWRLRLRWLALALLCLCGWAGPASAAGACSAYVGQATINEVRVGLSGKSSFKNQIEVYNSGGVAPAVWQTWQLVLYYKTNTGLVSKTGVNFLSSGYSASGQFIYGTGKNFLVNRQGYASDIALVDANGDFIDYVAIGSRIQTVPSCLGTPTVATVSSNSNTSGDLARITDGGTWPAAVNNTTLHTIGASNVCTAGGNDLVVANSADITTPVAAVTSVTYTVTVTNKSCSGTVSGIVLTDTGISVTNYSSLSSTATTGNGSLSQGATALTWTVGSLAANATATLTISGVPRAAGTLSTIAAITAPASGLVNTGNDSATETLTVGANNGVGFDVATASVTEGSDTTYSAAISSDVQSARSITVNYTVSGTGTGSDTNLTASGTVTIPTSDNTTSIDFTITNDAVTEPTKSITLTITSVVSADGIVVLDSSRKSMTITLLDDDLAGPDHYEIALPSTGISCLPSTVTITACAASGTPCSSAYTAASGKTATLVTNAGTLGATSVTFNAVGVATTTLSHPAASNGATATITLSGEQTAAVGATARYCCPNGSSCSGASTCSSTFSTAGFIIAGSANGMAATLPTQTAGTSSSTYFLRAIQTSTTTAACTAALTGATTVNWAYQCNDPATCSGSNLMSLNGGAATTVQRNPNSGVTGSTSVPMTFDASGNAPFTFNFSDVGRTTLWASKSVNSAALSGSSNTVVTKPGGFTVSGIQQTASPFLANPAAASSGGSRFVKAGESFSATVTATTSGGAVTPNYGRETSPEGVLLTRTLVLPAGGASGTLANGSIAGGSFSSGVATLTNLSFSETGVITLTAGVADGDYLGAGAVTGTPSATIGRFHPDRFALSTTSVLNRAAAACSPASAFTYLGETFRLGWTLTAQNTSGATTMNYSTASGFAKLDPTGAANWNLRGAAGSAVFSTANSRLSLGASTGSWSAGVASGITLTATPTRSAAPDGPFSIAFGIAPVDSDGVAMQTLDLASNPPSASADRALVGVVQARHGRLKLSNGQGSELVNLSLAVAVQSWNGSTFAPNTPDSCTTLTAPTSLAGLTFAAQTATNKLAAGETTASVSALMSGLAALTLSRPGAGNQGYVDVQLTVPAWLQSNWLGCQGQTANGLNDDHPCARATFGSVKAPMTFMREMY